MVPSIDPANPQRPKSHDQGFVAVVPHPYKPGGDNWFVGRCLAPHGSDDHEWTGPDRSNTTMAGLDVLRHERQWRKY